MTTTPAVTTAAGVRDRTQARITTAPAATECASRWAAGGTVEEFGTTSRPPGACAGAAPLRLCLSRFPPEFGARAHHSRCIAGTDRFQARPRKEGHDGANWLRAL
jgi:hypothetical protein